MVTQISQLINPADYCGGKSLEQLRAEQQRTGGAQLTIFDDKTAEYAEKLAAPKSLESINHRAEKAAQAMSYSDARQLFWMVLTDEAKGRGVKYQMTESLKTIIPGLLRYFIADPESPFPLEKGLFLYGQPGCGKTFLMQCLSSFTALYSPFRHFEFVSVPRIHADAISSGHADFAPHFQLDRCFDDVGFHNDTLSIFGNRVKPLEVIMTERYNRHDRYGQLTHFTSNLDPRNLATMFDQRVYDRCLQMFHPVQVGGQSFRK